MAWLFQLTLAQNAGLVTAGILPAVEPGRPARRIKRPSAETKPELSRIARSLPSFFSGGPSSVAGMLRRVDGTSAIYGRRDAHRHGMVLAGANVKMNLLNFNDRIWRCLYGRDS